MRSLLALLIVVCILVACCTGVHADANDKKHYQTRDFANELRNVENSVFGDWGRNKRHEVYHRAAAKFHQYTGNDKEFKHNQKRANAHRDERRQKARK